ncbi:hypothetical protein EXE59_05515 [Nocardioides eburneiflavus]|uniref:alpha-amylase n=1 Tax=Nocardioides eburneiflavus TaxID=2518372 RepID=A0A4Z1C882_9ACTN|nr:carboxypeptidase regulatory-like domain-containing protein [Nocardioides eburneiflavus]TGN63466.1 hypothetical protein EXE59_05515 [Nocardioides eburneiflavus]
MPRSSRPVLVLTSLAVATATAFVPVAPSAAAAASGGSISGQMLVTGGAPIAGAEVTLYAPVGPDWYPVDVADTDATGTYQLSGVAPGTYRLGFHDPSGDHATEYWSNWATLEDADDLTVAPGEDLTGKTVMVTPAGHVTGTVTDDWDAPLAGIAVAAYRHTWPWTDTSWERLGETLTTADGTYDLGGLGDGTYRLGFADTAAAHVPEFWDDAESLATSQDVVVRAGEVAANKDAQLTPGGTVAGTVTGASGALPGVRVTAYALDAGTWSPVLSTRTDLTGGYLLGGLPAGEYVLGFVDRSERHFPEYWDDAVTPEAATQVDVVVGATVPGRDAVLAAKPVPTPPTTTTPPATTTPTTTPTPTPSVATQLAALAKGLDTKGKPVVGRKVKVTNLVAELRTSVRYSFQWYSGSKKIRKATRSALKVSRSLRGKALKVRVKLRAAGTTKVVTLKVGKVR